MTGGQQIQVFLKEAVKEVIAEHTATGGSQIKALIREAVREEIREIMKEYARNATSLIGIVDSVRTAAYIIDHLPIARGMDHKKLRAEALKEAPAGACFEFGVFKAYWLNIMAREAPDRVFYGFDSFEGLPDDWANLKKRSFRLARKVARGPRQRDPDQGLVRPDVASFSGPASG